MRRITILIIGLAQLIIATTSLKAQVSGDEKTLERKIDNYLSEGVANGFSGSVLIAKEGKIILNKGYGMAYKEKNIPYQATTVSTIGSVTKQFTATAILKLVEFNQLDVTDPISKYFKKLPNDKKNITIHQLLTHSAGLIDVIGEGDFDDIPMKRFFKTLFATDLLHQPGSKYAYSNAGYSILARIIEIVSGQDYENFLNEHLFKPAGMKQTGYFIPEWDEKIVANGYARNVENVGTLLSRFQKHGKVTWTLKGNGGIHSTTGDMHKWYQALKANKILPKSLFEKLTTAHILEYEGESSYYGYGWAIYNSNRNTKIISHNGGNAIFFHDFIWLPEEDVVIIQFTNASSREVEVAWPIEKMIFEEAYQAKPIRKNLFYLISDFMKHNEPEHSDKLTSIIKEEYRSTIKDPNVLNDMGYGVLTKNAAWAVALFKLNTELFPKEGNIWDSLGEGYLNIGQKEEAIQCYQKALDLAPEDECHWCKGSAKALNALRKNE